MGRNRKHEGNIMTKITIYTLPNCVQCTATKKWLKKHDFTYKEINLLEDDEAYKQVNHWGYKSAPIVAVETYNNKILSSFVHWNGYRPEVLKDILIDENPE